MKLYLKYYYRAPGSVDDSLHHLDVPLETFVVLALYRYLEINPSNVVVHFVQCKATSNVLRVVVPRSTIRGDQSVNFIDATNTVPNDEHPALFCQLPSISIERINTIVSGLCGVCRRLTKEHIATVSATSEGLLGFKGNTLVAPADASLWTKFCEVDIIRCVEDLLTLEPVASSLPHELGQFESHLLQPLKSHNIYKLINLVNNVRISSDEEHQKLVGVDQRFDFHANHKFAEGYEKTLADLILFICFDVIERRLSKDFFRKKFPNTMEWLERVDKDDDGQLKRVCNEVMPHWDGQPSPLPWSSLAELQITIPKEFSLYKSDTKKLNLKGDQILTTNQAEVVDILRKVSRIPTDIGSTENDWEANLFSWDTVPMDARPEGGKLPPARILRKRHQLESLVNEVMQLANNGSIIVDFCSGTGHLGILLAYLLPGCTIYLLENKEESQQRAMERVERLALRNVVFFQCNLDYFTARFDIGVSLHACGVATDIVLEKCFAQRAHFVSCPCCYGKLYNLEQVTYPRSSLFQRSELLLREYFCIAHCADQTHDLASDRTNVAKAHQGFYCMDVIDRDRALRAEELGYVVLRKRLKDETCTPKNRLLVGIYGGGI
ncbi:glutathione S-transferase C-terminal domain-containing protein homolog isoform X1 [Anopheles stephensi]|uniref:glutathione S-transferase C-terminal domain-containing protein homolog isoform X1 n=1 Tax=Anopheles stephensi TaxID=30069 RepID=UPI001658B98F|nr:glutathione S-transferase C-terminal domain-containing protein homolog isoform X1 [Anopheles stephensi]XP_035913437.1 glutathione S-transferase C-terminal domain-containing protein homolog isoform X1 [Anopheles stephensi]XP_035913439.1 glutathione S-transferase C-terminal domain-containing protein homolog isoform X1 [Anopheles stephensi]